MIPEIKTAVTDNLDAKVRQGKIVADYRRFWKWWSVRWSIAGFFSQAAQSSAVAYMVWQFHDREGPKWLEVGITVFTFATFATTFASLYARLRKQHPDAADAADDNSEHA